MIIELKADTESMGYCRSVYVCGGYPGGVNDTFQHETFFYSRYIKTFVVSLSNHEGLVLLACIRSTLRLAQDERIKCSL